MSQEFTYQIFPLGDSAATVQLGNTIHEAVNKRMIALFNYLQSHPIEGCKEVVPAYNSITVYYDVAAIKKTHADAVAFDVIKRQLEELLAIPITKHESEEAAIVRIPVLYGGEDFEHIAREKNLSQEELIHLHTAVSYRVYMLGFLPGFAYMGETDERIAIGRKHKPTRIEAGSVGIAGRQTGIYPFQSPGGWYILGQTPLQLFDIKKESPSLLQAGNIVQFYSITAHEFTDY